MYLIRRPKGEKNSESIDKDLVKKIWEDYEVSFYDMLKNVRACNNQKRPDGSNTTISIGKERYPPCSFGLPYVESSFFYQPLMAADNEDVLPDWILGDGAVGTDEWDEPSDNECKLGSMICPPGSR